MRLLLIVAIASTLAWAQSREITPQEAHKLVEAAIPDATRRLPRFGLDDFSSNTETRLYFIEATWDNPVGSVVYGGYAVDKVTGDVWSAVVCRQVRSRQLARLQVALRRKIGLSKANYKRVKIPGPMCG